MLVWYEMIIANSYLTYAHEMFKSSKVYWHAIPEIYDITEKGKMWHHQCGNDP